ncbi:MAG: glycoside hydrolase family 43 protein [Chitinophagaceae bacterium]
MKRFYTILLLLISMQSIAQKQQQYTNPILAGFYPDPSICRVGNDYYLVTSTFAYFPGLPVFHSKDLVNWKQIGHAMDRPEQLDLAGAGVSRGLFAPTIRYHKGVYYIVCTLIDKGGNFVISATNPAGPWSNPNWLREVDGIDPSLFFDEDDKAYIIYNSIPPDNKPLWDGHRTIQIKTFDYKNFKTGEEKMIVNGGVDVSKKPVWIEAPHIYKIDGWYYLLCAEGGTGYHHSEVVFRSKAVEGPYVPYEKNPILTQRHLDPSRKNPITTAGHADIVQAPNGKWYAVFLGCRPYEGNHFNTGREAFMTPVIWKEGWPIINYGHEEIQYKYPVPSGAQTTAVKNPFSGNLVYKDDFSKPALDYRWIFLRTPKESWYSLTEKTGTLSMQLRPETCSGKGNPSFIAYRQQHLKGMASTSLKFSATAENEKAGIAVFQNEHHFYYLCKSVQNGQPVVQLYKSTKDENMELLASESLPTNSNETLLKIEASGNTYAFYFSTGDNDWKLLKAGVDAKFLSTETAGGFVGCVYALYATSLGKPATTKAYYDWFEYKGTDDVFK